MLSRQIVDFRKETLEARMETELGVLMFLFRCEVFHQFPEGKGVGGRRKLETLLNIQ